jgi:peptidoglycan/LPS O-acetylase OafA/YrhL
MYCSPFSVWQALGALFMGVTTITILEKAYSCNMGNTIKAVLLIAFVAMCAIYFMTPKKSVYWIIPNAFTPIIAFMFIYYFRDVLSRIRLFRKFGEHSIEIYIVQTPICILFYTIIPKLISVESVFVRILLTAVILAVCYYSAHVLLHVKIAKRLFFSRTWDDLTGKILSSGR